jgi:hypothetical protein
LPGPVTDSAATIPTEAAGDEDLGDLLLEVLPGDGSSLGNLSAREALGQAAGAEVSEVRWSGFSGQGPSLTSEAGHHPHQGLPNDEQATNPQP